MKTVAEAAKALGLSRSSLYAMAKAGRIEHIRAGPKDGKILFTEEQIERYLQEKTRRERGEPQSAKRRQPRPHARHLTF